jgi:hypothetical protein
MTVLTRTCHSNTSSAFQFNSLLAVFITTNFHKKLPLNYPKVNSSNKFLMMTSASNKKSMQIKCSINCNNKAYNLLGWHHAQWYFVVNVSEDGAVSIIGVFQASYSSCTTLMLEIQGPLNHQQHITHQHGVTSQKTKIFNNTNVRTSSLTNK